MAAQSATTGRCCTPTQTAQAKHRWDAAQAHTRAAESNCANCKQPKRKDDTLGRRAKARAYQARSAGGAVVAAAWPARLCRATGPRRAPPAALDGDNLETQERDASATVQAKTAEASKKLNTLHTDIVRQMGKAKHEDRAHWPTMGREVEALPPHHSACRCWKKKPCRTSASGFRNTSTTPRSRAWTPCSTASPRR